MKVKLEFTMIVDTDDMSTEEFNELCETFKSYKDYMPTKYPSDRTWWGVNKLPEGRNFTTVHKPKERQ